jgi:hypothetical protein
MSFFTSNTTIVVAIIAAIASVVAALVSALISWTTARSSRIAAERLEEQKGRLSKELASETAHLAQVSAERDARRDYEYDARKRLYAVIEPLLFQLYEALEEAHYRVRSLARTSRDNRLLDWLYPNGYYLNSTVYKLICPAVFLRLMQRQMTFVDMRVDETIRIRYQLLKLYSRSLTDDFVIAPTKPPLQYDPNNEQWRELKSKDSATYMRQALVLGDLENICDALIVVDADHCARAKTFSEFEAYLANSANDESMQEILTLFTGFSPIGRPVLARLLVAQAVMAQLILSTYGQETEVKDLPKRLESIVNSQTAKQALAWQNGVACGDLPIALAYWKERLSWLQARDSWIEADV